MSEEDFIDFLISAKTSTYASGNSSNKIKEADSSTTLIYEEGDWKYHDNYFGGEPYGGREVVLYQGKPYWMMVYYGWVEDVVSDVNIVYSVLQGALREIPRNAPYRGPESFEQDGFVYRNSYSGTLYSFSGEESIQEGQSTLYRAKYIGGLVDK